MHQFVFCTWSVMFWDRLLYHELKTPSNTITEPMQVSINRSLQMAVVWVRHVSDRRVHRFSPRLRLGVKYVGGSGSGHGERFRLRRLRLWLRIPLVPGDESGIELNHGRVPSIYKVAKRSEGHLISKWLLVVWEDAKQQGCY